MTDMTAPDRALAAVRRALGDLGIGAPAQVRLAVVSESENVMVSVTLAGATGPGATGPVAVIRVGRPGYHRPEELTAELDWLEVLAADPDLHTVRPYRGGAGSGGDGSGGESGVIWVDGLAVTAFEFVPGTEVAAADCDIEHYERVGEIAARLHRHGAVDPVCHPRFRWDGEACIGASARWGDWREGPGVGAAEIAAIGPAAARVAERLAEYGTDATGFGLIHADLRAANLMRTPAGELVVIDFDDSGYCWYLYDFAAAVSFVEADPRLGDWVAALIRGYRRERPLPPGIEYLPDLIMVRRLQLLAWLGTHPEVVEQEHWAADFAANTVALAGRYLGATLLDRLR